MLLNKEKLRNSDAAYFILHPLNYVVGFIIFALVAALLVAKGSTVDTFYWALVSGIIRGGLLIGWLFFCLAFFEFTGSEIESFFEPGPYKIDDPINDPHWPHEGMVIEKLMVEDEDE